MTQEDYIQEDYDLCHYIRASTTEALKKLMQESNICETSGNGDVVYSAAKTDTPHQSIGTSLKGMV